MRLFRSAKTPPRLFILGLDGSPLPLLQQLMRSGDLPNLDELTKNLQAGMKNDTDYCLTGKTKEGKTNPGHEIQPYETSEQEYRIGDNKGLGNVFVWIMPEKDHYFDIPADQLAKF